MIKKLISFISALSIILSIGTSVAFCSTWSPVYSVTDMTDNEKAIKDLSVLSLKSSAMLVNGATRYIDDDNPTLTPVLKDAKTYIPLTTAQDLFNAYLDYNDTDMKIDFRVDVLGKTIELDGATAKINDVASSKNELLVYINNVPYIPLRKLAETLGKIVDYQDGYIVIRNESTEKLTDLTYVKGLLDAFVPTSDSRKSIYVDCANSSDGNGTLQNPYKTIAQASEVAKPGDTIYIKGGTYRETIAPTTSGTATLPIIYKAYGNEEVIISANDIVNSLVEVGDALNTASGSFDSLGDGRNQIFVNGQAYPEARYPNINDNDYTASDISDFFPTKGDLRVGDDDSGKYTVTSSSGLLNQADNHWAGGTFVSLHGSGWVVAPMKIASSTSGSLTLDSSTEPINWWYTHDSAEHNVNYGYITGHVNAIDKDFEWAIDDSSNRLVIKLPIGKTVSDYTIEAKQRQLVIDLKDKEYIQIDGLKTIGGGINMNGSEMCVIKNCDIKYLSHYTYAYDLREGYLDKKNGVIPESNNALYSLYPSYDTEGAPRKGEMGIYISGNNDVIKNNKIDHSAAAALYMTGCYTKVYNNDITNCGYMGSNVSGIYIGSEAEKPYDTKRGGYVIMRNTVRNSARSPLIVQPAESGNCQKLYSDKGSQYYVANLPKESAQTVYMPMEISYNEFSNGGLSTLDVGVVYFWGATMGEKENPTRFHHNIVYSDSPAAGGVIHSMIYHDNYVDGMATYDNIMFNKNGKYNSAYWNAVYVQKTNQFQESYAEVDLDNDGDYDTHTGTTMPQGTNKDLNGTGVYSGTVDNIPVSSYPDGKYFKAGCFLN